MQGCPLLTQGEDCYAYELAPAHGPFRKLGLLVPEETFLANPSGDDRNRTSLRNHNNIGIVRCEKRCIFDRNRPRGGRRRRANRSRLGGGRQRVADAVRTHQGSNRGTGGKARRDVEAPSSEPVRGNSRRLLAAAERSAFVAHPFHADHPRVSPNLSGATSLDGRCDSAMPLLTSGANQRGGSPAPWRRSLHSPGDQPLWISAHAAAISSGDGR